ncbi:MAG TPA: sulfotransferase family 2 domain-containing protein [Pirellulales bacterium]|nr:sulfotransferase family 2 domain-containing protein [Pirellulales bacterium]
MIVSFLRRFVYFGPPKTASTSLHEWLSQPLLCDQPWRPESGDQHDARPPAEASEFFAFASIRNPYSRAVSLWRHRLGSGATENPPVPQLSFADFLAWLPNASDFYARSQAWWLAGAMLDFLLPFERIERVLDLPPIAPLKSSLLPLPHRNATSHAPWPSYYDSVLAESVYRYFRDDFEILGYRKEIRADSR